MLYSVSQTLEVVVEEEMEWLAVNGSFPVNLILLVEVDLPQLMTSVEVEDPVQFS